MTELTAVPTRSESRRLRRGLAAAAVLLVVAAAAWWVLARDDRPSPGPLLNQDKFGFSFLQHPGDTIGYGVAMAWNTGDQPVVLKRIRLVDPTPGLEVIDTRVSGQKRKLLALDRTSTWPSDEFEDIHPVAGYRVAPRNTAAGKRGVEFLFGLHLPKLGNYESQAVAIEYTVGDTKHLSYVHASLLICVVPKSQALDDDDACGMPSGIDKPIDDPAAND
jgi:hypothetical protein